MKLALVASGGGHLNELLRLEGVWEGRERFFVTTGDLSADDLSATYGAKVYVVAESNHRHPLRVAQALLKCVSIMFRERPNVVVSTGAAHGCLMCALGKLAGAKVVWVDSIANVDRPSLSGRIVRYFADVFIVQWPELVSGYKGSEYHGQLV